MKKYLLFAAALLLCAGARAKVVLPHVFGDNMVLQQKTEAAFWGTASARAKVTIAPSWTKDKTVVTAGSDGKWSARVQTPEAGGPYEIELSDGEKTTLSNVLVGEVWFCSGQSNMEMPVKGFAAQPVEGSLDEILNASTTRQIRVCNVVRKTSFKEEEDADCRWVTCSPGMVASTSATAWFFASQLERTLGVPVGLVLSKWGGTKIESWMDRDAYLKINPGVDLVQMEKNTSVEPHRKACTLFNGMVAPVIPFTVKGWIWYQGESNRQNSAQYAALMEGYAQMMRSRWNSPAMPFYYVQIAPYRYTSDPMDTSGALLMEAQEKALDLIPNSGMATTLDVGDPDCIHPARKRQVGQRLAALALEHTYGMKVIKADAPRFTGFIVDGKKMVLSFNVDSQGLAPLGHKIVGFEVAGEDKVFHPADARVAKDRHSVEVVIPAGIGTPAAVRYAFHDCGVGNLTSCWGIPVGPFRSDSWE